MTRTNFSSIAALAFVAQACGGSVYIEEGAGGADGTGSGASGPATSTSSSAAGVGGEGGGPVDPVVQGVCERLEGVVIYEMALIEQSGDGAWSPGERITLRVTLWNMGDEAISDYPGVHTWTNHPYVVATAGDANFLFGLEPGGLGTLEFEYEALDFVPVGESVFFEAQVGSLIEPEPCPEGSWYYAIGYLEAPVDGEQPPPGDDEPPHGQD